MEKSNKKRTWKRIFFALIALFGVLSIFGSFTITFSVNKNGRLPSSCATVKNNKASSNEDEHFGI